MPGTECTICYDIKTKSHKCVECSEVVCRECWSQITSTVCPHCQKHPGPAKWLEDMFMQRQIQDLKIVERPKLASAQVWLDYTIEVERITSQYRFGIRNPLPAKPQLDFSTSMEDVFFPCGVSTCRGFVSRSDQSTLVCGQCKSRACDSCREVWTLNHTCKDETLKSLELLRQDTKPCPQCKAWITRTEGCNHMFCTQCRNHFDWVSLKSLQVSTNGHYNQTVVYNANVATIRTETACIEDLTVDAAKPGFGISNMAKKWLYEDARDIRYMYKLKFGSTAQMATKYATDQMNLRVKYLRNQCDEPTFLKQMWTLQKHYKTRCEEEARVKLVLRVLHDLQVLTASFEPHWILDEDAFVEWIQSIVKASSMLQYHQGHHVPFLSLK